MTNRSISREIDQILFYEFCDVIGDATINLCVDVKFAVQDQIRSRVASVIFSILVNINK